MTILKKLVGALAVYAPDKVSIPESDIRQFASDNEIQLRDDNVQMLARFGCASDGRLDMFRQYGGDFGLTTLQRVASEKYADMETPSGHAFFGSNFVGDTLCVHYTSGQVFVYDDAELFGLVHESIDGFLLTCLLDAYQQVAFGDRAVTRELDNDAIEQFRHQHASAKIVEATWYYLTYDLASSPKVRTEYYYFARQLHEVHPGTGTIITLRDGILLNV